MPDKDTSFYMQENQRLTAEVQRLKDKCNAQIKYIDEHKATAEKPMDIKDNSFMAVFEVFYLSVEEAVKNGLVYELKRETANSRKFSVIEAKEFRAIIKKHAANGNYKKMLDVWLEIGLVEQFSNGRLDGNYSCGTKPIRVIRVSKDAISLVKEAAIRGVG